MIHLDPGQRLFLSEDCIGYADKLKSDGVFTRQVDLLLYGFSYAVNNNLPPAEDTRRHELTRVTSLGEKELPISAVAQWYAENSNHSLEDEQDLLHFICRVGIAGVRALREKWEGRRKLQIQWYIITNT